MSSKVVYHESLMQACVSYIVGRANEDRYTIATLNSNINMYAVYDGHGGTVVVDYVKNNLPTKLANALDNVNFKDTNTVKSIITQVFIKLDEDLLGMDHQNSGTTVTVALISDGLLYLFNLADSRAILFNSEGRVLLETVDHDTKNKTEIERVQASGGFIKYGRVGGILAVTRALGDFYLKPGPVIAVPDIHVYDITGPNLRLLIASDGLWEGKYKISSIVARMATNLSCNEIAKEGRCNYASPLPDDITVIVVNL